MPRVQECWRDQWELMVMSENNGGKNVGAGLAIGVGIGVVLGVAMDNIGAGLAIGIALGIAFGAGFNNHPRHNDSGGDQASDPEPHRPRK